MIVVGEVRAHHRVVRQESRRFDGVRIDARGGAGTLFRYPDPVV
jgi:hypothetical protein